MLVSCSPIVHIRFNHFNIYSACLSLLQGTSVNLRTTFTTSTLYALRSETWKPALSCLRLPSPHMQVICISPLLVLFVLWCKCSS